jgi:hypothetical protein
MPAFLGRHAGFGLKGLSQVVDNDFTSNVLLDAAEKHEREKSARETIIAELKNEKGEAESDTTLYKAKIGNAAGITSNLPQASKRKGLCLQMR